MNKPYMQHPYLIKISGNDYLTVPGRLMMFRDDMNNSELHGTINTNYDLLGETVIIKASVLVEGILQATGHATVRSGQGKNWSGREIEKAETAAIGRALAHAGYGTQFAIADMEEDEFLADSPIKSSNNQPPPQQQQPTTNSSGNFWTQIYGDAEIKKLYEHVNVIVNTINKHFPADGEAQAKGYPWMKAWLIEHKGEKEST